MIHFPGKLGRRCGLGLFAAGAAALCLAVALSGPPARSQNAGEPRYARDGSLLLPTGFETWVFAGSNLGLSYTQAAATAASATPRPADIPPAGPAGAAQPPPPQFFHNVSIPRAAYDYFLANGRFPDRTMLVMQVFEAANKEPRNVLSSGVYNGRRVGLEVAVKNMARPDGSRTPWAYYDFTDRPDPTKMRPSAAAFPDTQCANCHQRHAAVDYVWVQFYPALRDAALRDGKARAPRLFD
jgi:hypothetical protein